MVVCGTAKPFGTFESGLSSKGDVGVASLVPFAGMSWRQSSTWLAVFMSSFTGLSVSATTGDSLTSYDAFPSLASFWDEDEGSVGERLFGGSRGVSGSRGRWWW